MSVWYDYIESAGSTAHLEECRAHNLDCKFKSTGAVFFMFLFAAGKLLNDLTVSFDQHCQFHLICKKILCLCTSTNVHLKLKWFAE